MLAQGHQQTFFGRDKKVSNSLGAWDKSAPIDDPCLAYCNTLNTE